MANFFIYLFTVLFLIADVTIHAVLQPSTIAIIYLYDQDTQAERTQEAITRAPQAKPKPTSQTTKPDTKPIQQPVPQIQPTAQQPQQQVQYVYVPYIPEQPSQVQGGGQAQVQYVYVPQSQGQQYVQQPSYYPQQQATPQQQAPVQKPQGGDGTPQVGEVMTVFAKVLAGIIQMGVGAEAHDTQQQAQGLTNFINSGAQLISVLTRQPCTPEQFADTVVRSIKHPSQQEAYEINNYLV